jgi:uncharacterized protein YggU (UPF0235/DUF167 family)
MMTQNELRISSGRLGSALAVLVKPGVSVNRIAKIDPDGALYIELDSDHNPVAVNKALVNYLATMLGVNRDQIEIVAGEDKQKKLVSIIDIRPDEVQLKIEKYFRR